MKLELIKYTCARCATSFDAPALGEDAYGEFLLRSKNGEMAYLNAFMDLTYKEVDNLLSSHPKASVLQPLERAKILRRIYGGLACDLDSEMSPFEIDALPLCPSCGSQQMASWEFKNPPEILDVPVSAVTHNCWSMLSDSEKLKLLDARLAIL
ncbi:hypothetical protein [Collimonas fungivorans]|uniref:hypothetical protein n=1 Tax=Collimonas fungivorans TaxID=158899 RepID=UPI0007782D0E|nr:hypothetical protein [Collimonas fungivorans]